MRFFHLADLHIGKRVNDFSMIEDQRYILNKVLEYIDEYRADVVLIAGDVYDKSIPSAEAVTLFDDFLSELATRELTVVMISGNHDSPERLAFASKIMKNQNIHISPVFDNEIKPLILNDEYGEINVYMLPYIKPVHVRKYYPDKEIKTYNDAVKTVVENIKIDTSARNIILAHQFITSASTSESEEIYVGTMENISAEIFGDFDYVALGHLHRPQKIKRETLRYSGSPLKYSFSEAGDKKSITYFDLPKKGENIEVKTIPLIPLRDMVEIKGKYSELVSKSYYKNLDLEAYYHISLTDENDVMNALAKLRSIYKNIMKLDYDNIRTSRREQVEGASDVEEKRPIDLLRDFYKLQNNADLSEEQESFLEEIIEKVWEK